MPHTLTPPRPLNRRTLGLHLAVHVVALGIAVGVALGAARGLLTGGARVAILFWCISVLGYPALAVWFENRGRSHAPFARWFLVTTATALLIFLAAYAIVPPLRS